MQLAALSCVLYVMQYFINIIHSYSGVDYRLQIRYWTGWNQAAGVLKINNKSYREKIDRGIEQ